MFRPILIARAFGIPIRVHWTLIVFGLLYALAAGSSAGLAGIGAALGLVGLVFLFVLLHELGHAIAAQSLGVSVRDITLYPIGGIAKLAHIPREPRAELIITAAGPAVNFVLAGAFGLAYWAAAWPALLFPIYVNLALGLFNLIPGFPLDGGRILRALLATRIPYVRATRIAGRIGQFTAIALGLVGIVSGHFMLVLIAFFVYSAAATEMAASAWGSPPPFATGPPPGPRSSGGGWSGFSSGTPGAHPRPGHPFAGSPTGRIVFRFGSGFPSATGDRKPPPKRRTDQDDVIVEVDPDGTVRRWRAS